MMKMKHDYDIVIVDSGVNLNHPMMQNKEIFGFSINVEKETIRVDENFQDHYGHGTAIYGIISKSCPEASIINIKIVEQNDGALTCEQLVATLKYIYTNINCRIINLSLGIRSSQHKKELYEICLLLKKKGVILVSAFDNEGCISYPAAFDCVIGVEKSDTISRLSRFEFVKDSIVNIRTNGAQQKIPWTNPPFVFLGGNSMACAHATSIIFNLFSRDEAGVDDLMSKLEEKAEIKIVAKNVPQHPYPDEYFQIKKASVFPFNKEMHALIRFRNTLNFDICSVHDIKQSGKVGALCNQFVGNDVHDMTTIIQNITDIPWENIDTLIIGHCGQLIYTLGFDIRYQLICEAASHNVNIYSFDPLCDYMLSKDILGIKIYWPQITQNDVPYGNFNKLYHIDKPIISVMGTSSRQGKFTLQNALRQLFIDHSYNVGCISTEPNGYLLGMDYIFPVGYQAFLDVTEHQKIQVINKFIYELCEDNDVIIAAGQANSIPFSSYMLDTYPVKQNAFLMGLQSDIIVLCVNQFDEVGYIQYTISYLEGISQCKVCALVLFPMTYYQDWRGVHGVKHRMSDETMQKHCVNLEIALSLPCFSLGDQKSVENLFDYIIEQLGEE